MISTHVVLGGFFIFISFKFSTEGGFNKTVPQAYFEYQMIRANSAPLASLAIHHVISWSARGIFIFIISYFVLFWNLRSWGVGWGDVFTNIAAAKKKTHFPWVRFHAQREFFCITNLAYGCWARNFVFASNKKKTMLKLFWPPLILNSRILG